MFTILIVFYTPIYSIFLELKTHFDGMPSPAFYSYFGGNCNPGVLCPPPTLCYISNRYKTHIFTSKYKSESPSPLQLYCIDKRLSSRERK